MEIIKLDSPKTTIINRKEVKYNKMEVNTHEVKPTSRVRFADIDPTDIAKNILHNATIMGNGEINFPSPTETTATITDVVDSTLIINKWVFDNEFIRTVFETPRKDKT